MKPKNKGMNKKDLFVILILIVMVIGVILAIYNSSNKPESWTYNDLIDRIEANDVNSIVSAMCKTEDKKYIKELTHKCTLYLIQEYQNNIIAQRHVELYKKYL